MRIKYIVPLAFEGVANRGADPDQMRLVPATADAVPGDIARLPLRVDAREQTCRIRGAALRTRWCRLRRAREELLEALLALLAPVLVNGHAVRV